MKQRNSRPLFTPFIDYSFLKRMKRSGAKNVNPALLALAATFGSTKANLGPEHCCTYKKLRPYLKKTKLYNPFKWLEFVCALLYFSVARLSAVGAYAARWKKGRVDGTFRFKYSKPRIVFRVLITFPFYLPYFLIRFITSPRKTLLKKLFNLIEKYPRLFIVGMILGTLAGIGFVLFSFAYPAALTLPLFFPYIVKGITALTTFFGIKLVAVATMTLAGAVLGFITGLSAMFTVSRIAEHMHKEAPHSQQANNSSYRTIANNANKKVKTNLFITCPYKREGAQNFNFKKNKKHTTTQTPSNHRRNNSTHKQYTK